MACGVRKKKATQQQRQADAARWRAAGAMAAAARCAYLRAAQRQNGRRFDMPAAQHCATAQRCRLIAIDSVRTPAAYFLSAFNQRSSHHTTPDVHHNIVLPSLMTASARQSCRCHAEEYTVKRQKIMMPLPRCHAVIKTQRGVVMSQMRSTRHCLAHAIARARYHGVRKSEQVNRNRVKRECYALAPRSA